MLYARDIMTTEVLTVSPETSIADLSKTLENRKIGGLPVVDKDGLLVGVITQSDLVERARDLELPPAINILDFHFYLEIPSHLLARVEKMLGTTVGDCMSANLVTVAPDTPVSQIAALMAKENEVATTPIPDAVAESVDTAAPSVAESSTGSTEETANDAALAEEKLTAEQAHKELQEELARVRTRLDIEELERRIEVRPDLVEPGLPGESSGQARRMDGGEGIPQDGKSAEEQTG